MNDINKNRSPEELYRQYQATRDDIPASTYQNLASRAEAMQHEDNIHLILERAKVSTAQKAQSAPLTQKKSVFAGLKSLFSASPSKAWGTAFASFALAIVAVPLVMQNASTSYTDVAHLEGCSECARYIADASVVTRSAAPGINRIDPTAKIAAKLGRVRSNLTIADALNNEQVRTRSLEELNKLNKSYADASIASAIADPSSSTKALIDAIDTSINGSESLSNFEAARQLQIANITARYSLDTEVNRDSNGTEIQATLNNAVDALSQIPKKTVLQQAMVEKLETAQRADNFSDPIQVQRLIDLYGQALQSLGA